MDRILAASFALALVLALPGGAAAQTAGNSTVLAPIAGPQSTAAPGQAPIAFYGTDLGFTIKHAGQLRILFGDTIADIFGNPIGAPFFIGDDSQGMICLQVSGCPAGLPVFVDGDAVDAYVASHPPAPGEFSWQKEGPPIRYRLDAFGLIANMPVYRGPFIGGTRLSMGPGRTPVLAFSNAKSGSSAAAFAMFYRGVALQCSGGATPTCPSSFFCDRGLGSFGGATGEDALPCVKDGGVCRAIPAGGFCEDITSSMYDPHSVPGRLNSIVLRHEIGNADPSIHEQYYTQSFYTRKFANPTARTVNNFDETRADPNTNDYNPPDATTSGKEKVFIWGRPAFVGAKATGQDAQLYLMVADLPSYNANGSFSFNFKYFTGVTAGKPTFSPNQVDAVALDLSGIGPQNETWDVVNQLSVAFVAPLKKWVMIYGGGENPLLANLFSGGQGAFVQHDPEGAVHVRFAQHPWGPWSAPQQLFKAGNYNTNPPVAGTQYAANGILRHPGCTPSSQCVGNDPFYAAGEFGFMYGVNIVGEWTEARGTANAQGIRDADIYWVVSTWDPYQAVLMKSRLVK